MMSGLKVAVRPPVPGQVKVIQAPIRSVPVVPKHREHKDWSGLSCTLDYMKCKTLGEKGGGGF